MPVALEKLAADMSDGELLEAVGNVSDSNVGSALTKVSNAIGELEADDVAILDGYEADEVGNLSGEHEERMQRNHAKWTVFAQAEERLKGRARKEVAAHQEAAADVPDRSPSGIDGVGGFVQDVFKVKGSGELQLPKYEFSGDRTGQVLERNGEKMEIGEFGLSRSKYLGLADDAYRIDAAPAGMEGLTVTRGQDGVERPEMTVPLIYRMFDIARILEYCTVYATDDANKIKVMRMNLIADGPTPAGTVSNDWGKLQYISEGAVITTREPTFTSVELEAYKNAWLVILANEFMRDRTPGDIEGEITAQCAVKAGLDLAQQIALGGGTDAPNGIITALDGSASATKLTGSKNSTGRTGAFVYAPLFDDFYTLMHSLAEMYVNGANFWTSWKNLGEIRRIKDDEGRYLLNRDPGMGRWNREIEGHYVICSPGPPVWAQNSKGSLLFGDFAAGAAVRLAGGLRIEYSPHWAFDKDSETVRVIQEFDVDVQDETALVIYNASDT